jgi:hypothetical protein
MVSENVSLPILNESTRVPLSSFRFLQVTGFSTTAL